MGPAVMLSISSLLSIVADASRHRRHRPWDIERRALKHGATLLVVFLYGTLVLAERRSGQVIMLLVGLFAVAMLVIHMRGPHYGEIARSTGGFFFVWTLWALGGLGGFTFILSARGLWNLPWRRPR